ncbi:hypothetical protein KKB18_06315, partial [bacterium]|nr:hypothetical protein [bacterium]
KEKKDHFINKCGELGLSRETNYASFLRDVDIRYIQPTLKYFESEIIKELNSVSLDSIANQQFFKIFETSFNQQYPETFKFLQQISEEFAKPEESGLWDNIGNSCRAVLITFSSELKNFTDIETNEFKAADPKNIISKIITVKINSERMRESLIKLLKAAWDHSQSLTHRPNTTKEEAQRLFLWIGLIISEIARIIDKDTTGFDEIQK